MLAAMFSSLWRSLYRSMLVMGLGCVMASNGGEAASAASAGAEAAKSDKGPVRHVEAAGAQTLLKEKPETVVLDVRTPREFATGHIEKAKNVNFQAADFGAQLEKLDRNKTYLVHCAAGGRSTQSLEVFKKLGFKSVVHLDGGFNAWTKAGLPVAK